MVTQPTEIEGTPAAIAALQEKVRRRRLPSPSTRRRTREQAGVSLRDVAEALGVSPMTVWRWETGATPRPAHAIAYRQLLDALEVESL